MQVNKVLGAWADSLVSGKRGEALSGVESAAAGSAGRALPAQVLSAYDVTHITPAEISGLLRQLRESGAISDPELRDLGQIRGDLERAEIGPHEPVNLLEFYKELVGKLQKQTAAIRDGDLTAAAQRAVLQQELAGAQKRQQWVQKLAVLQEAAGQTGVDMAA